jgi:hypothetical protein
MWTVWMRVSTGVVDRSKRSRKMLSHLFALLRRCLGDPDGMWFTILFVAERNVTTKISLLDEGTADFATNNGIFGLFMLR